MYIYVYVHIYVHMCVCVCVCVERERETCVLSKGFELESFPLKFNPPTFEYKIHSVEVDLYYSKPKIKCFEYFLPMHQEGEKRTTK